MVVLRVYTTLKPWLFSQVWTAPTCACDGALSFYMIARHPPKLSGSVR
jgi:hypothetical protein